MISLGVVVLRRCRQKIKTKIVPLLRPSVVVLVSARDDTEVVVVRLIVDGVAGSDSLELINRS